MLLVHGSAADHTTWSIQLASPLRERFTLIAYDRRDADTVEAHAADAAEVLAGSQRGANDRALVVGSSFGSVIAIELMRTRPELCAGAVLIEPPMASDASELSGEQVPLGCDERPAAPAGFLAEFDRRVAEQGGPAAGEFFLRTVLGDAAFERMPRAYQERSKQKWASIRADSAALIAYRPRYAALAAVDIPTLLVGGDRSASYFRPTLEALLRSLPRARLEIVAGAGHMLHAEAHRRFGELLVAFADEHKIE